MSTRVSPPFRPAGARPVCTLPGANLSAAPELLLRPGCLQADRCSLHRGRWRGCHPPSGTASIRYAGLKQLGNRSLIRLEQFIRPLQPFQSFGQRLDLLIMRLISFSSAAISSRSRLWNVSTEFISLFFLKGRRPVVIVIERSGTAPY